jgi:hypothetical protein
MTRLSAALIGTWELRSREDRNRAGEARPDPALGADPVGFLFYDRSGRFALQLMKRERPTPSLGAEPGAASGAATRPQCGYDAYFGTYCVDDEGGVVTQTLLGALSPDSVGQVVTREMSVLGDTLTIRINTTSVQGEAVTRMLRWRRLA